MRSCWQFPRLLSLTLTTFTLGMLVAQPESLPTEVPGEEVLTRWLEEQQKIERYAADFLQQRTLLTLRKPVSTQGKFWYSKPNRFRWELGEPAKRVAIQDGETLMVRNESKKTAEIIPLDQAIADKTRSAIYFDLSLPKSKEDFLLTFDVQSFREEGQEYCFHVLPKDPAEARGLERMTFLIDKEWRTRSVIMDLQEGSQIATHFSNFKEPESLPAELFQIDLTGYRQVGPQPVE